MSRIDVLIFGASGFTGKYTVKEIIKIANKYDNKFTWGIAGRNKDKLKAVLDEQGENAEVDLSKIPIVIADIHSEESLNEMAKKAKVILNCCGPYRVYGEPVVKACIANKTHHVDVSGEPQVGLNCSINNNLYNSWNLTNKNLYCSTWKRCSWITMKQPRKMRSMLLVLVVLIVCLPIWELYF